MTIIDTSKIHAASSEPPFDMRKPATGAPPFSFPAHRRYFLTPLPQGHQQSDDHAVVAFGRT
jgi:hypothetical protein